MARFMINKFFIKNNKNFKTMKKIILSIAILASVSFVSCSSDDETQNVCETCDVGALVGIPAVTEFCDNGDGTITSTVFGESTTESLDGLTFEAYVANLKLLGITCN
jgi:hypothetical protein